MLIMKIGPLPDAMEPDIHCVRTHWIRGFIAFRLARRARTVVLMVPAWPESGFGYERPNSGPNGGREQHETRDPQRLEAVDPGFQCVPGRPGLAGLADRGGGAAAVLGAWAAR